MVRALAQGLIAYFPFNITTADASGHHHDAAPSHELLYRRGFSGHAASFNRRGARVQWPPLAFKSKAFSLSAWVRLDVPKAGAVPPSGVTGKIAGGLDVVRATDRFRYVLDYERAATEPGRPPKRETRTLYSKSALRRGAWEHVVVAFSGDGFLRLYLNGALDEQLRLIAPEQTRVLDPFVRPVGSDDQGDGRDYALHGAIDELLLYDRALKPVEIAFLARRPTAPSASGAVASQCGGVGESPCEECAAWRPRLFMSAECVRKLSRCKRGHRIEGNRCETTPDKPPRIESLPKRIELAGDVVLQNVEGFQAIVENAPDFEYVVPDGRELPANEATIRKRAAHARAKNDVATADRLNKAVQDKKLRCADLGLKDSKGNPLDYSLYTLRDWAAMKHVDLAVNANWFNIDPTAFAHFPHLSPCTQIHGYSAIRETVVSDADTPDNSLGEDNFLDAFLVLRERRTDGTFKRTIKIVPHARIPTSPAGVLAGVGGFILMEGGVIRSKFSSSTKLTNGARTGLAISANGRTLYLVVVQGGPDKTKPGMTAKQLAQYLYSLGGRDAINLDNSGSSQFYAADFTVEGDDEETFTTATESLPGDLDGQNNRVYRPIPTFLGLRY